MMPNQRRSYRSAMRVKSTSDSSAPWGQIAQVVNDQQVKVVQLSQHPRQLQISFGCKHVLNQSVGRDKEHGAPRFHQPVSYCAHGMGLTCAGHPEGEHVDAGIYEVPFGKPMELLPQLNRRPIVLKGVPCLVRGQLRRPPQTAHSPNSSILRFLLHHLD